MINELLLITYKWCGENAQIIQGYVLCDNHIDECKKYSNQFLNSATFSSEDFKILAAKKDDHIVVIIFSNQFLFDPSKCSFLISANGKKLPYFPKQMHYKLDLQLNYRIPLKNYQNHYNLREQIYFKTFQRQITSGSLIPIIICPKLLLSNIWEYFVEQGCYVESFEELQESIMLAQRQVQLSNAIIANTMINGCALFQKYLQIKPKYTRKEIENDIMNLAFSDLEHSIAQFKGMPVMISQNGRFTQQLLIVLKNMISQFFTFIQETIDLLLDNDFDPSELSFVLEGQIENQVGKLTIQIHEFALVEQADFIILFEKIKETIYDIHKDIENFIVDTSLFVNEQMQKVNELFQDFPALANVRTFQSIQTEASQHIVHELQNYYLKDKSIFWRPDHQNTFQFVKKILIQYLDYNEPKIGIPAKTTDFFTSLIRMGLDPKMPIQTIQIIVDESDNDFIKQKDNLIIEKISKIKNGKREGYKIYLQTQEIIVLQMIKHQVIVTSFEYFNQSQWQELEPPQEFKMTFAKGVQFLLETNIEFIKNVSLYELNGDDQQLDKKQSELLVHFSMNMDDQLKKIKNKFCKKIDKAQKGSAPQPTDPSIVAAGAIGSGLGILIVDCLDENISWQQKLQRAGYGTAETTAFAALSMNLPFIGFLVGQTFLFYSVHKVFSNKVLSMQNKLKNMGHLGVKTSMGIGSAVAGQILIPVPVLGALIGSVVGGVGVGLYHKFIVPSTKNSLIGIINRLEQTIQPNGQLLYEKQVIKMMKINPTHFFENQPSDLNCSDWLTLVAVHLINEVSYLYQMQWEEERKKVLEKPDNAEKIEKMVKLDIEEDQLEEKLCKWDVCRYYISQQKISTFKYAKQVGIFVTGMISNFKM